MSMYKTTKMKNEYKEYQNIKISTRNNIQILRYQNIKTSKQLKYNLYN